jgi:hypothetical protein
VARPADNFQSRWNEKNPPLRLDMLVGNLHTRLSTTPQLSSFPRKRESMMLVIGNDEKAEHQNGFPLSRE